MNARLLFGLAVAAVVLMVYSIVDCAMIERSRVRGLPRAVWIIVIIVLPVVGAVLWLVIGRGRRAGAGEPRHVAPDDDPEFLSQLRRDAAQQERIHKLEQELADLDHENDDGGDKPADHRRDGDKPGRTDA